MTDSRPPTYEEWLLWTLDDPSVENLEEEEDVDFWPGPWFLKHSERFLREIELNIEKYGLDWVKAIMRHFDVHTLSEFIWGDEPAEQRHACIRSMVPLFRHFFSRVSTTFLCHMWWDIMQPIDDSLDEETLNVVIESLEKILNMDSLECCDAALHGLGHFDHPRRREIIDTWLSSRDDLDQEIVSYAHSAREGKVL